MQIPLSSTTFVLSSSSLAIVTVRSFVGHTASGKSFLIRALQGKDGACEFPTPISAAGKTDNHLSTSSDIHLYIDSATVRDQFPIHFLDCEGFEGSDLPISLKGIPEEDAKQRRKLVETAYPRLVYAFSTCIVFVTSG